MQLLEVLEHLVQTRAVAMDTPVALEEPQAKVAGRKTAPLAHALLLPFSPVVYAPQFYSAPVARRLLDLDRGFFSRKTGSGGWWAWDCLIRWANEPDRQRYGFADPATPLDEWAAQVIAALPGEAFGHPRSQEAWVALLRMDLGQAAAAFANRQPGQWLRTREDSRALVLREARGAGVFAALLGAGLDLLSRHPDPARPGSSASLWQRLLPARPKTCPEPGSFREALEQWLTDNVRPGDPDWPAVLAHKAGWITASLTTQNPLKKGQFLVRQERLAFIERIKAEPAEWMDVGSPPGWLAPLLKARQNPKLAWSWAKAVASTPALRAQAGVLAEIVAALFRTPDPGALPEDAWRALAAENRPGQRQWLRDLARARAWGETGPGEERLLAEFDRHRLAHALPKPGSASSGPRL